MKMLNIANPLQCVRQVAIATPKQTPPMLQNNAKKLLPPLTSSLRPPFEYFVSV